MTPFHYSNSSDFVRVEYHLHDIHCEFPIFSMVLQTCNLTHEFLESIKLISGADFYFVTVIDYDAYRNDW